MECQCSALFGLLLISRVYSIDLVVEPPPPLPFAQTNNGWVQGYAQETVGGHSIFAFEGIRYAQAPSGQLRFKDPVPTPPWTGVYEAVTKSPACLQLDMSKFMYLHGTEDCLFLNVYTPQLNNLGNHFDSLPVIIYIYGGGFIYGRSSDIGPAYLLNHQNVVLVTINYRVGVLGFFSSGDDAASGNWGMKDQALAIKWVVENIRNFGGDPTRIMLAGNSAGAASAGLHMMSPLSKNLFQQVILESGSPLAIWAVQNDTYRSSMITAQQFDCPANTNSAMVSCLRTKDANWIVGRSIKAWKILHLSKLPFGPVVESQSPTAFLTEAPEVSYLNGRVPAKSMIVGLNKDEGSVFAAGIQLYPGHRNSINLNWNSLIPYVLSFENRTSNVLEVAQKIKKFYLEKETKITFRNRKKWMRMFGDRMIVQGAHSIMRQHSKIAPTFGYMFSYAGERSIVQTIGLNRNSWGVAHTNEMIYLYNNTNHFPNMEETHKDFKVSETLVNLWTSFAESGIPSLNQTDYRSAVKIWKPISPSAMKLLEINFVNQVPRMIKFPQDVEERVEFWKSLRLKDDPVFP